MGFDQSERAQGPIYILKHNKTRDINHSGRTWSPLHNIYKHMQMTLCIMKCKCDIVGAVCSCVTPASYEQGPIGIEQVTFLASDRHEDHLCRIWKNGY